jgi:hypothetical protein
MAFSGSISGTTFNANRVVDTAFRRCRLPAQAITSEMQQYALDALYLLLSEMANIKTPSWCIEKLILPFYENQPVVPLPVGTVEVLNANYRVLQEQTGTTEIAATTYKVLFDSPTTISTVGVKWSGTAVPLLFEVSDDNATWVTVGTQSTSAAAGEITWTDITGALAYNYFRITSTGPYLATSITLGNMPQEIPFGVLNRDTYVAQSNKIFPGRPNSYWFQRDTPEPLMHIWPAPFVAAEQCQLIVWRHRHIMDTQNLRQEVEVPQRWLDAIIAGLAARVASESPQVDVQLIPMLDQKWLASRQAAWDGDNDGSPTFIQPAIGCYTR